MPKLTLNEEQSRTLFAQAILMQNSISVPPDDINFVVVPWRKGDSNKKHICVWSLKVSTPSGCLTYRVQEMLELGESWAENNLKTKDAKKAFWKSIFSKIKLVPSFSCSMSVPMAFDTKFSGFTFEGATEKLIPLIAEKIVALERPKLLANKFSGEKCEKK